MLHAKLRVILQVKKFVEVYEHHVFVMSQRKISLMVHFNYFYIAFSCAKNYCYLRPQTSVQHDIVSCRFICEIFTKIWRLIKILAKRGQNNILFTLYNSIEQSPS
jgi:hypothetical protein